VGDPQYKTNFFLQFNDPKLESVMSYYLLCSSKYSIRGISLLILYLTIQLREMVCIESLMCQSNLLSYLLFCAAMWRTYRISSVPIT